MPSRPSGARPARASTGHHSDRSTEADSEPVTITLDAAHLQALIGQRVLFVEDFYCADKHSRASVRQMLLRLLRGK